MGESQKKIVKCVAIALFRDDELHRYTGYRLVNEENGQVLNMSKEELIDNVVNSKIKVTNLNFNKTARTISGKHNILSEFPIIISNAQEITEDMVKLNDREWIRNCDTAIAFGKGRYMNFIGQTVDIVKYTKIIMANKSKAVIEDVKKWTSCRPNCRKKDLGMGCGYRKMSKVTDVVSTMSNARFLKGISITKGIVGDCSEGNIELFRVTSDAELVICKDAFSAMGKEVDTLLLDADIIKVDSYGFRGCKFKEIIIRGKKVQISPRAFIGCCKINKINMESGIDTIKKDAFYWLRADEVSLSVNKIGSQAFNGMRADKLTITNDVELRLNALKGLNVKQLDFLKDVTFTNIRNKNKIEADGMNINFYRTIRPYSCLVYVTGSNNRITVGRQGDLRKFVLEGTEIIVRDPPNGRKKKEKKENNLWD